MFNALGFGQCKHFVVARARLTYRFCGLRLGKGFFEFSAQCAAQNANVGMNVINAMCAVQYHAGKCLRVINQCVPSGRIKKHGSNSCSLLSTVRREEAHSPPLAETRKWFLKRVALAVPDVGRQGACKHSW